jgi:long-chain acyl-CoA synthetase
MALETLVDLFQASTKLADKESIRDRHDYQASLARYGQIAHRVAWFASFLQEKGLKKGDHVLLWGENCSQWVVAFWACVVRGIIVVPIDQRFSASYVQRIQEEVQASLVIYGSAVAEEIVSLNVKESLSFSFIDHFKGPKELVYEQIDQEDIVEIVYTSGTTGTPKGVVHRHTNICANLRPLEKEFAKYKTILWPIQPIRILNTLPLSHMFGQALGLFVPILLGGCVVFVNSHHPGKILETLRDERVTALVSVPRLLLQFQNYIDQYFPQPPSAPKRFGILNALVNIVFYRKLHTALGWKFWVVVAGGAQVKQEIEKWWGQRGFVIVQGYGLTEASPIVSLNHPFHVRRGSLGKALEGNEVKIAPDGEILVRGQSIASQYTGQNFVSATGTDGWFHTGDLGEIDANGNLYYLGRKKDVIVTPEGYNVFPSDIEEILNSFDLVRESVVVGVETGGKTRIQAVFTLEDGQEDDVNRIMHETNRRLQPHQRLQGWSIWPEDDFPRTLSTMKVKRGEVVAWVEGSLTAKGQRMAKEGGQDKEKISEILGHLLGISSEQIRDDLHLTEDLGLSSLDALELIVQLEHAFGISLDEAHMASVTTFKELKDWVSAAQGKGPSRKSQMQDGGRSSLGQTPLQPLSKTRPESLVPIPQWPQGLFARMTRFVAINAIIIPLFQVIIDLRVKGLSALDQTSAPVLFAANHSSHLDTLALLMALPVSWRRRITPGARQEHFAGKFSQEQNCLRERLQAHLQYALGALFFNLFPLSQKIGGTRRVLHHMSQLVKRDMCPLIYPEGRFSPDGSVQLFQPGIGLMAQTLQLPVVPVRIKGTYELMPPDRHWPRRGRVTVCFGCPLTFEKETDSKKAAKRVEEAVRSLG